MSTRLDDRSRAWCSAMIAAIVDLPDCLAQLRSTREASERSSCSCQKSGTIPKEWANSTVLSGTGSRSAALSRAAMRLLTLASESATLQPLQPLQEIDQVLRAALVFEELYLRRDELIGDRS